MILRFQRLGAAFEFSAEVASFLLSSHVGRFSLRRGLKRLKLILRVSGAFKRIFFCETRRSVFTATEALSFEVVSACLRNVRAVYERVGVLHVHSQVRGIFMVRSSLALCPGITGINIQVHAPGAGASSTNV